LFRRIPANPIRDVRTIRDAAIVETGGNQQGLLEGMYRVGGYIAERGK